MLYLLAEEFEAAALQAPTDPMDPEPQTPSTSLSTLAVPAHEARREADRLRRERDLDGLRTLAMSSQDMYVRRRLALLLLEMGDEKGLFDLAVYSRVASRELVEMLGRQGRIEDLLRQLVCGNGFAKRALESGWTVMNLTDSERARILRDDSTPMGRSQPPAIEPEVQPCGIGRYSCLADTAGLM
jgi:hypothetical protein